MKIYHITTRKEWIEALENGFYWVNTLDNEGFIHCCTEDQIDFVLENWFKDQTELVVIEIEPKLLSAELRYEKSEGDERLFPHLFGTLNLEAVVKVNQI